MNKKTKTPMFIAEYSVTVLLALTFLISAISFVLMLHIPAAQTPESSLGLPVWLIAIWSPNMAAILLWWLDGKLVFRIKQAFSPPPFSWWTLVSLAPLFIAAVLLLVELQKGPAIEWSNFEWRYILPLVLINLFLGPLGEELGWRGLLYPALKSKHGWMASALLVGVIWTLWHAPLWLVESPHSRLPFWAFALNVILLSVLMSMIHNHSRGSLLAIVLLHLTFNVSLGLIDILGSHPPGEYIIKSLYLYIPLTLILVGLHEFTNTHDCKV